MYTSSFGSSPETSTQALTESQNIFKSVFGNNANLDPQSTNGLFIQEIANQIINNDSGLNLLYNGIINPQVAPGIFLDAICAFNQIARFPATYTTVTCQCTGLSGTVIPAGSQALDTSGNLFSSSVTTIIPDAGTIDIDFTCLVSGAISVNPHTVTTIVQTVSGWDTIDNAAGGNTGSPEETDYQLRVRRLNSLAKGSTGTFLSLTSKLYNSSDISDFYVLVNNTSSAANFPTGLAPYNTTTSVPANSIYASIYGGTSAEIGEIFYGSLNGCGTSGGTTISYTDPAYNFVINSYKYQIPSAQRIEIDVRLPGTSGDYPSNITQLIQQAVYNNWYGLDGSTKVSMRNSIFVSRFEAAIVNQVGIQNITSITIGLYTNAIYTELWLPITQVPTLAQTDVIVIIG